MPHADDPIRSRAPLGRIAVFGGGTVALLAALALKRALPGADVTLVIAPVPPAALADRAHTAFPAFSGFNTRLGIEDGQMLRHAAATHRLATRYRDWRADGVTWIAGYGAGARSGAGSRFVEEDGPGSGHGVIFEGLAAALAQAGRFAEPSDKPGSPWSDIDVALRFDPSRYRGGMVALARQLGIVMIEGHTRSATFGPEGAVATIALADGRTVKADLFVDAAGGATGPMAVAGRTDWIDWSNALPVDRILLPAGPASAALSPLDETTAIVEGWLTVSPARDGTRMVLGFGADTSPDDAARALYRATGVRPGEMVTVAPGRTAAPFCGTCVALGDAAARFEPLGWGNLHLAIRGIELLIELLPGRRIDDCERTEYNRRWALAADRMCDFVGAHYANPVRHCSPFWQRARQLTRSVELQLMLDQYGRRGRLPHFEEDIVPADLWRQILDGTGAGPGLSAVEASRSEAVRREATKVEAARIDAAVAQADPYADWLEHELGEVP